jgi:putative transposase
MGRTTAIARGLMIPSTRVIRALDQLVSIYGGPEALRMDNGPELISECGTRSRVRPRVISAAN